MKESGLTVRQAIRIVRSRCRCMWRDSHLAEVAELVDALGSGLSWGNPVEVQVLSSAPDRRKSPVESRAFSRFGGFILQHSGYPVVTSDLRRWFIS